MFWFLNFGNLVAKNKSGKGPSSPERHIFEPIFTHLSVTKHRCTSAPGLPPALPASFSMKSQQAGECPLYRKLLAASVPLLSPENGCSLAMSEKVWASLL